MIIVFSDGLIFSSAEKRLLAKASLRWVKVSMTFIGNSFFWLRVRWLWCVTYTINGRSRSRDSTVPLFTGKLRIALLVDREQ